MPAFIGEPVQGAGGVNILPPEGYWGPRRRHLQAAILLVSDEVITGFGRPGIVVRLPVLWRDAGSGHDGEGAIERLSADFGRRRLDGIVKVLREKGGEFTIPRLHLLRSPRWLRRWPEEVWRSSSKRAWSIA